MKSLKRALIFMLCLSFATPAQAAVTHSNAENARQLVEEFISVARSEQPLDTFGSIGKSEYLETLVLELGALEPEDFNNMMYYLMNRYGTHPEDRAVISALIEALHGLLAPQLAENQMVRSGPNHYLVYGATRYALIVLAGAVGWRVLVRHVFKRKAPLLTGVKVAGGELKKSKRYFKYFSAPGMKTFVGGVGVAAVGAGAGYFEYWWKSIQSHRHSDPRHLLVLKQVQMLCELSYQGYGLQQHFNRVKTDAKKFRAQIDNLSCRVNRVGREAADMVKQLKELERISYDDPFYVENYVSVPKTQNWDGYGRVMGQETTNGQCQMVAGPRLAGLMDKLGSEINNAYFNLPPEQTETPAQEPAPVALDMMGQLKNPPPDLKGDPIADPWASCGPELE